MLIRNTVLERIFDGEVDLVFRRQKRPTVRTGGTLRTQRGMLDIVRIDSVALDGIVVGDARRAGYDTLDELLVDLTAKPDGDFYRVEVRPGGDDPRAALQQADELDDDEVAEILARLDRLDRGRRGDWTRQFLHVIAARPHVRAPDLAASIGWETQPFKEHVRKLKALGLTISHNPGYELSPRGRAVLSKLPS
ncbi:MAG: hypothetical protein CL424_13330 [Acidimicrobiaceae bacterium]|nr:hypothetical protein [Acidimicrobiaceae bacterium]